ncbi:MAG: hydrogenase 3 maturation endopeptidase HyCI [Candidatus Omnitrophica bacterium]|nr:hydrogenase 3 maturation endopeptidase HyCI [Candidatus Omnitrophota bacterium]MDD5653131.1 hydrogenase 3 maturation endopeptidase HyCI [Candidatus Omnitrophota bacterium]
MEFFEHLKAHLKGRVVILGIGNSLKSDDALGSLLAIRLQGKAPFIVYDAASTPENYLGKIIRDNPDNVVIIDAADFGGKPGEYRILEGEEVKTVNLYSTHNASLSLTINYLQSHIKADIIILIVQPKSISFGDKISPEIAQTLEELEGLFNGAKEKG